ncbi:carbonic anhydrase 7 isoform X2 [Callorhinchus milii]|nr:carbonic anhydrase 7 isoform X2 [Callorhinchus milii]|eukprot:gi/632978706/ref/XP_007906065.1/ PREDICTED: carbonic anhydrase 7 isoform X2 [Callorhinchus milii]
MPGHHCWGYGEENGPSDWYKDYSLANGDRQSPIDIQSEQTVYNSSLKPIWVSYDACTSLSICNNGHSVMVEYEDCDDKTVIRGGPLEFPYRLKQFHFHWGGKDSRGSEHTVNGKSYPGELHLVHWNAAKYKSFDEAASAPDGLAVLGVFLETGEKHSVLHRLTDALYMVRFKMEKFRTLFFSGEEEGLRTRMMDNFRPPQPLKGRTVEASFRRSAHRRQ